MCVFKIAFVFVFIFISKNGNAQSKPNIQFLFSYGSRVFTVNDSTNELDSVTHLQITDLKFYVSDITFLKNKTKVFEEKNSYHLIDITKPLTHKLEIKTPKLYDVDEIVFNLGIDSITNTSGSLGGDLDPTKGMYWTWQSGYINFKLEGKSMLCKTRNNEFQFHLGGYTHPNYCLETIVLPITSINSICIQVDVKKIIKQLNLSEQNKIMSPTKEAVILSRQVANCFSIIDK